MSSSSVSPTPHPEPLFKQAPEQPPGIIVFDGVCLFCNGVVNFIIPRDVHRRFVFAPMQSQTGQRLLQQHGIATEQIETFLLVLDNRPLTKSDAALAIAAELKRPWCWLRLLRWVPAPLRNLGYSLIARNRYRLFGKSDACVVPDAEVRSRFLE